MYEFGGTADKSRDECEVPFCLSSWVRFITAADLSHFLFLTEAITVSVWGRYWHFNATWRWRFYMCICLEVMNMGNEDGVSRCIRAVLDPLTLQKVQLFPSFPFFSSKTWRLSFIYVRLRSLRKKLMMKERGDRTILLFLNSSYFF